MSNGRFLGGYLNYAFHRSEGGSIEIKLNDLFTGKMLLNVITFEITKYKK